MTEYTVVEVSNATNALNWTSLHGAGDGFKSAIVLNGEAVLVTKVQSSSDFSGSYNEDEGHLSVVIEVGSQFFKKGGWHSSHSGAEWNERLIEVRPAQKYITVFETA
jgi:hypothetical protein